MKKSIVLIVLLFLTVSCMKSNDTDKQTSDTKSGQGISKQEITVYKNPNCGCCTKWVEHMRANGFKLTEKSVDNLSQIKDSLGVPKDKRSCHTSVLGNYVFEGHIPAASIKKFLKENKASKGLVVPGMPMGSPGMDYGPRKDNYNVYSFDEHGQTQIFDKY